VSDHFWLDPDYEAQVEAQSVRLKLSTLYPGYPMTFDMAFIQALMGPAFLILVISAVYILFGSAIRSAISGINVGATVISCKFTPPISKANGNIDFSVTYKLPNGNMQLAYGASYFDGASVHRCEDFPINTVLQVSYQQNDPSSVYINDSRLDHPLWETLGVLAGFFLCTGYAVWGFIDGIAKMVQVPVCEQRIKFMQNNGKLHTGEVIRCTRKHVGSKKEPLEEWTLTYKFSTPQSTEIIGKQRARNSGLLKRSLPEPGISVTVVYANDHTYCVL